MLQTKDTQLHRYPVFWTLLEKVASFVVYSADVLTAVFKTENLCNMLIQQIMRSEEDIHNWHTAILGIQLLCQVPELALCLRDKYITAPTSTFTCWCSWQLCMQHSSCVVQDMKKLPLPQANAQFLTGKEV